MSPFVPIGERARWRVLYDLLSAKEIGEVLTYDEMGAALGLDDRHPIQTAFRKAARYHEEEDCRAVEAIRGEGYRVVEPVEQLRLARTHQRKSGKSLERGQSKVVNVDLGGLEPDVRKAFELTANALGVLVDFSRRLDVRQDRLAEALESMTVKHERTEEDIANLKERLARLESLGLRPPD